MGTAQYAKEKLTGYEPLPNQRLGVRFVPNSLKNSSTIADDGSMSNRGMVMGRGGMGNSANNNPLMSDKVIETITKATVQTALTAMGNFPMGRAMHAGGDGFHGQMSSNMPGRNASFQSGWDFPS